MTGKRGGGKRGGSLRSKQTAAFAKAAFIRALVAAGLPEPVLEHRFDARRRWQFDIAWPAAMIAVEIEGGMWVAGRHTSGAGFKADMEKYNRAVVLGWRLLRVSMDDVRMTRGTIPALAIVAEAYRALV